MNICFLCNFNFRQKLNLADKIAVVTGVSSGLGAAIAKALTQNGVIVYGLARNKARLEIIQKDLGEFFHPVQLDISKSDEIKSWTASTFSEKYSPDILINNAGTGSFAAIDETPAEQWFEMVNTNLNGTYNITSQIVPFLKKKKHHTHIINIGSILGTIARENASAYSATKFGLNGFSEALFKELRNFSIKVSIINPGSIDTDFFQSSGIKKHHNMLQADDLAETVIYLLKTPDNMLIDELTVRPLNPKAPDNQD